MLKSKRTKYCLLFTLLFALLCSAYRYLSLGFSGDSTLIYQGGDVLYQISLGRFLQPVYWLIRGQLTAPFLIGFFATAFFLLSTILISDVLLIHSPLSLAILCGIIVSNETIAVSNATYLPWTDVYALSLLFCVLGVYMDHKLPFGFLISPIFYVGCLGLYSSYITCAATLLIIKYLKETLEGTDPLLVFKKGIRSVFSLLLGLLLYALVLKVVLSILRIPASNEYNGVGRLAEITPESFLSFLPDSYMIPLKFLFDVHDRQVIASHRALIPVAMNLLILLLFAILLVIRMRRLSTGGRILTCFLLLVLPFGMDFVYLIANGIINGLMIFSFYFFYLLCPIALETIPKVSFVRKNRFFRYAFVFPILLVVLMNVRFSNQLAIKRDVEYQSTLSAVSRILEDAESTPGYVPGETEVIINGYLPASRIAMVREGFEPFTPYQGARYTYAAAYETSTEWYIEYILGRSMNIISDRARRLLSAEELDAMPRFPSAGYVRMMDGILYINL